jgi:kinesin family protein 20
MECTLASSSETNHRWAQPDTASVSVPADIRFSIWISFFEIYNELLYDLLEPPSQQRKRQTLRLCEDQNGNPYVKGMWMWGNVARTLGGLVEKLGKE